MYKWRKHMIKNGQQELELQEHQQDAYNAVQKTYEQGNRAAVVIPTGCGKSFIALKHIIFSTYYCYKKSDV